MRIELKYDTEGKEKGERLENRSNKKKYKIWKT